MVRKPYISKDQYLFLNYLNLFLMLFFVLNNYHHHHYQRGIQQTFRGGGRDGSEVGINHD